MFRSPHKLRSGSKGQPVPLSTDKEQVGLKSSSTPTTSTTTTSTTMASSSDKSGKVDSVAECVDRYLANGDVIAQLVAKISVELKSVVEEAVRAAISTVNREVEGLRSEVAKLTQTVLLLDQKLATRTDELEQYQRRNNIRVFGIDEKKGEDTDKLIVELCRTKLGVDLPTSAISRSHRVGSQPQPGPDGRRRHRPIIVRFVSYRDRRAVYGAKKLLKGTGVTVREDLTTQRMEVLRRAIAQHGVRNTWTQDGRVLWIDKDGKKGVATVISDLGTARTDLTK